MDIEAIVEKHLRMYKLSTIGAAARIARAALTELAAEYDEERKATEFELSVAKERIKQLEADRVSEGWQLVPVEPTQEMLFAVQGHIPVRLNEYALCYKRMLAAAPEKEGE